MYGTAQLVSQFFPPLAVCDREWDSCQEKFEELLTSCIDVLLISRGSLTFQNVDNMMQTVPQNAATLSRQINICKRYLEDHPETLTRQKENLTRTHELNELDNLFLSLQHNVQRMTCLNYSPSMDGKSISTDLFPDDADSEKPSHCILHGLIAVSLAQTNEHKISANAFIPYLSFIFCQENTERQNKILSIWSALRGNVTPLRFM